MLNYSILHWALPIPPPLHLYCSRVRLGIITILGGSTGKLYPLLSRSFQHASRVFQAISLILFSSLLIISRRKIS